MYDVGDAVALSFTVTDSTGAPAAAGTVVLTVTLPDGSTATPAVTNPTLGTYVAAYATTQSGLHRVSWVATGANARSTSDVFQVAATDPGFILSLAQARSALGIAATVTAKDEDLRTFLAGITPIIEDIVGPVVARTRDEWHDGGAATIKTLFSPLISVTAVTESYGPVTRTLTAQPLNGGPFDSYGFTVDLETGLLTRRIAGRAGTFRAGRQNVRVQYVAGRSVIPQNIVLAARRLVRHLWQSEQQGLRPDMGSPEAMAVTPSGYAVPRAVIELCAGEARIPGIA